MIIKTCLSLIVAGLALSVPRPVFAQVDIDGDLVGRISTYTVSKGDNATSIARHHDIGLVELLAANPDIASSKLTIGRSLVIPGQHILPPAERRGIVINLAELRLFLFLDDGRVMTFPISIGREGWQTPVGTTTVTAKRKNPTWTPPASIRAEDPTLPEIVPAGPNNPLGQYALNLGWSGFLIHGTNQPGSIGKPASHGCIRMYPEDIAVLFAAVEPGAPVTVIDAPIKLGRVADAVYIEVTPSQEQARQIAAYRKPRAIDSDDDRLKQLNMRLQVMEMQGEHFDYEAVKRAVQRHDGVPTVINQSTEKNENSN
jgi:L,D-transpeptidase ErfK/SrfK